MRTCTLDNPHSIGRASCHSRRSSSWCASRTRCSGRRWQTSRRGRRPPQLRRHRWQRYALAFTRYCHNQYCMVYVIRKADVKAREEAASASSTQMAEVRLFTRYCHTYVYIHRYICVCVCVCVCVYIHIHIYIYDICILYIHIHTYI